MSEDYLGSGLYLDTSLDFDPNGIGDLRTVDGSDELQKDLAFQLLITLQEFVGPPLTPAVRADIKDLTIDTITSDTRVDDIDRGSLRVEKPDKNTIRLQAIVTANGTKQELVFTI